MISGVAELVAANALLEEAKAELRVRGQAFDEAIEVGSMIEIPGAAAIVDLLARHCSFFSVGTNDLIQSLLAVDRVNDRVAHLYEPGHPAVLRTLRTIFRDARAAGRPVGVCGEMAGEPLYAPLLFGLGADEISVAPPVAAEIKFLVRRMTMADARMLADDALAAGDPIRVLELLRDFHSRTLARTSAS